MNSVFSRVLHLRYINSEYYPTIFEILLRLSLNKILFHSGSNFVWFLYKCVHYLNFVKEGRLPISSGGRLLSEFSFVNKVSPFLVECFYLEPEMRTCERHFCSNKSLRDSSSLVPMYQGHHVYSSTFLSPLDCLKVLPRTGLLSFKASSH